MRLPTLPPALRRAFCARHVGAGATSLAIHLSAGLLIVWMSARVVPPGVLGTVAARPAGRPLTLFAQATSADNAAPGAERPATKPLIQASNASGPATLGIRIDASSSALAFTGFTVDVGKVTSRAAALFPFLTRQLTFNADEHAARRASRQLFNPFSADRATTTEPPLMVSDAEVQRLIDQAWSRRERWTPFQTIRALAEQHSPDVGQVAPLLRGYVTQNAFQPYVEPSIRDPRIWTQLALAADHERFLDFIVDYAAQHPGTRATVELLFFLDILAQSSQDTLLLLLEIEPAHDLRWTRNANPAAYGAFAAIHKHYALERNKRGLAPHKALVRHYDQIRLGILNSIVQTSPDGYRVGDAQFLIGQIHWRRDRRSEARKVWRAMDVDPRDRYAAASSSVLAALREEETRRRLVPPPVAGRRGPPREAPELDARAINHILDAEYDRWVSASRARLLQFGYRLDTF